MMRSHAIAATGRNSVETEYSFRRYAFELAALADPSLRRISVIAPSYNHRPYLEQCLRSIREQTYPIFEVIVLDDASSDGGSEWLAEHLNEFLPHARLILNLNNSGSVWDQWRKGVEAARGDYIWIAESDDCSETSFLAEVPKGFDDEGVYLATANRNRSTQMESLSPAIICVMSSTYRRQNGRGLMLPTVSKRSVPHWR